MLTSWHLKRNTDKCKSKDRQNLTNAKTSLRLTIMVEFPYRDVRMYAKIYEEDAVPSGSLTRPASLLVLTGGTS
jgi:hypothetical protein